MLLDVGTPSRLIESGLCYNFNHSKILKIDPDIIYVGDFINEMAQVKFENGTYNFINSKGTTVIPFNLKDTYCFHNFDENGLAWIKRKNGKENFVNKSGHFISKKWFKKAFPFKNSRAIVVLSKPSEAVYNLINSDGKILGKRCYCMIDNFSEGFARISRLKTKHRYLFFKNTENFIDLDGQLISKTWFAKVHSFKNGFAKVKRSDDFLWNFIDYNAKILSNDWFQKAHDFGADGENTIAWVMNSKSRWNFIDCSGKILAKRWFSYTSLFKNGFTIVDREDEKQNFMGINGKLISKTWYPKVFEFSDGFSIVEDENSKFNFIDTSGKIISKDWFQKAKPFIDGFGQVIRQNKTFYINKKGVLSKAPSRQRKIKK